MFDWFRRGRKASDPLAAWRVSWTEAVEHDPGILPGQLRAQLDGLHSDGPDLEVELEMLDALEGLRDLQARIGAGQVPIVQTHHRVIGTDTCHFSAPASLPEDASQASGRVLLTGGRAIFVGGGRTGATPWHAVHDVFRAERDVLLVRADGSAAAHFRFNTFGDAVGAAFLARHLRKPRAARL